MRFSLWFALAVPLLLTACASKRSVTLSDLDSDEGYVVFRFYSGRMKVDPDANWRRDIRLHYRPFTAGPIDAFTSTMKLRGRYVAAESGRGPSVEVLKLTQGEYEFYTVVTGMQEKNVNPASFRVKRGQFLYIGDLQLDVDTIPGVLGVNQIRRAAVNIFWQPNRIEEDVAFSYPEGAPPVTLAERW